jgi:hypothetical protein
MARKPFRKKKSAKRERQLYDRAQRSVLRGYWRYVLRVHYGIPGAMPNESGDRNFYQATPHGVIARWPLAGFDMGTLPLIDSVHPAGQYLFGDEWRVIFRQLSQGIGEQGLLDFMISEFGMIPPHVIAGTAPPKWYRDRKKKPGRGRKLFPGPGGLGRLGAVTEGGITWADTIEFIGQSNLDKDAEYLYAFVESGLPVNEPVWTAGAEVNSFYRYYPSAFYMEPDTHAVVVQLFRPQALAEPVIGKYESVERAQYAVWILTRWFYGIYADLEDLVNEARESYDRFY